MVRRCVSTVLPISCFWKNRPPQTGEHMVEVKRIKAPSDIAAEGKLCPGAVRTVRDGPGTSEGPNSHGADGKRDKVKLDEFAAAVETAKTLAETGSRQSSGRRSVAAWHWGRAASRPAHRMEPAVRGARTETAIIRRGRAVVLCPKPRFLGCRAVVYHSKIQPPGTEFLDAETGSRKS